MQSLDPIPAVRRLDTSNKNVFALEIDGRASSADAENLFGLLEGAFSLHDRVDILIRTTEFEGADWGDISPDTIAQGRQDAEKHVRRCAIIGGPDWAARLKYLFAPQAPVELRYFGADEEPQAWAWLDAREIRLDV